MKALRDLETRLDRIGPATHAILRIGAALLFLQHGVMKLFGWFGGVDGNGGTVELMTRYGVAGVIEVFGSILIIIGLATRPVAALFLVGNGAGPFGACSTTPVASSNALPSRFVPLASIPVIRSGLWEPLMAARGRIHFVPRPHGWLR